MACNNFPQICPRTIISDSVSIVTVDGVDTLLIDIPLATYMDGFKYGLVIAQAIPTAATIDMPVAVSIGGDTTTVYPLTDCSCSQLTACSIRTRTRYPVMVSTTATSGVFKVLGYLRCSPNNDLASLPILAAATTTTTGGAS